MLFAILLFLGVAIVLGLKLENGGGGQAELVQAALPTEIILVAVALAPIDESGQAFDRVTLVLATVVYVLLARTIFEREIWSYSRPPELGTNTV